MRSRNFEYNIDIFDNDIDNLQQIECEYHIYGYKNKSIRGYIHFPFTKTLSAAESIIGHPSKIVKNTQEKIKSIQKLENIWEKGKIIKKEYNNKKEKIEIKMLCNLILKQHDDIKQQQEENQKLHEKIEETLKQQIAITNTPIVQQNITDNSKNKKITNIQVFLNTQCKDAITLQDFVQQIEISDEDMNCLKEYGYVESVTRLLKRALKDYDVFERPLHCTDIKREILHIKSSEGWKKETSKESPGIDKAFRQISHKHTRKCSQIYKDIPVESVHFEEKAAVLYKLAHASGSDENMNKKKILRNLADNLSIE